MTEQRRLIAGRAGNDTCSDQSKRLLDDGSKCGENDLVIDESFFAVDQHGTPADPNDYWGDVVGAWESGKANFTIGCEADCYAVGKYTQLVWATSTSVGCGIALCDADDFVRYVHYVCLYCPA